MKTIQRYILTYFVLVLSIGAVSAYASKTHEGNCFVPGQIIVKLKSSSTPSSNRVNPLKCLAKICSRFTTPENISRVEGLEGVYILKFEAPVDVEEISKELSGRDDIDYAEPNYMGHFCEVLPNDPDFTQQWHLKNTGQTGGVVGLDIDATAAWEITTGSDSIVVAVVDTGVDYNHPDLEANIWHNPGETDGDGIDNDGNGYVDDVFGWDFVSVPDYWAAEDEDAGPQDNDPMDRAGHGTYCSGAIAAVGNNAIGITGVSWGCKIMPVRIGFRRSDGTSYFLATDAAKGIRYAANNGARVINLSWIIRSSPEVVSEAIRYARSKGVVVVGAAGNDDAEGAVFPSSMPEVIAVAATDASDDRALWLEPQPPMPGEGSNYGLGIDVAAPGDQILTTSLNSQYVEVTGTSISAAITSGISALILSAHPDFTAEEVRDILRSSVESEIRSQEYIGYGRVDAYRALLLDDVPVADISYPDDNAMLSGSVNIEGSADGHRYELDHYTLEYGPGIYPLRWTTIIDSSTPVQEGTLATWDTDGLDDGKYTLKIKVYDSAGNYNIVEKVVYINEGIHSGWPVTIQDEIVSHPVAGDLDGDGYDEIVVCSRNGNLYVYRSSGELMFEKFLEGHILTTPTVADMDGDGYPEIIVATDNEFTTPPSRVYMFKNDGTPVNGWPKDVSEGNCLALSVGDLNNDGAFEIVASTLRNYAAQKSIVYVWNSDGSTYGNGEWPKEINLEMPPNTGTAQDYSNQPVLADLDKDNRLEIIVSCPVYEKGTLFVWKDDGSNFPGWPKDTGDGYTVHPVVGDIDRDGHPEIVGIKKNGKIIIWNSDGSAYMDTQWPKDLPGALSDPVLADLDGDGNLEIVTQSNNGHVYVYHNDGSFLSGWPIDVETPIGSREWAPLCVGDVDGDGSPDIVAAGGENNKVYVWDSGGRALDSWPRTIPGASYTSPVIGDIDSDGKIEIVTTYANSCVLWDLPGSFEKFAIDWPMFQHDSLHSGKYCWSCKGDLDNDGDVDGRDIALFSQGGSMTSLKQFARALGSDGLPVLP